MARISKRQLLEIIVQSIRDSGWNVLFINTAIHPFILKIYKEEENYLLRIYVWNVTHGGGRARAADEYRIQITGVDRFEKRAGEKTLILGWWGDAGVFAGFDYTKHSGRLGASPSMQIREEFLNRALINGFSPCDKGNEEIAIAFRPDFFVEYVRNLEQLHGFGESEADFEVLEDVAEHAEEMDEQVNDEIIQQVSQERLTTVLQVTKKIRDNSFKQRVLTSYGNRCAFSSIQLKLVDAAHILPVSETGSTDETSNGIALSPLYHRAFDKGLVTFNERYQIIINENEMAKLREIGFDGGMESFRAGMRAMIHLPPARRDRPNVGFINEANRLRGWNV